MLLTQWLKKCARLHGQSAATTQVAAGSTLLPATPTFEEGKEVQDCSEEELLTSLGSGLSLTNTARSTTTGTENKVNYEFILFVNMGGEERLEMPHLDPLHREAHRPGDYQDI